MKIHDSLEISPGLVSLHPVSYMIIKTVGKLDYCYDLCETKVLFIFALMQRLK